MGRSVVPGGRSAGAGRRHRGLRRPRPGRPARPDRPGRPCHPQHPRINLGQAADARADVDEAIRLDPDDAEFYTLRASTSISRRPIPTAYGPTSNRPSCSTLTNLRRPRLPGLALVAEGGRRGGPWSTWTRRSASILRVLWTTTIAATYSSGRGNTRKPSRRSTGWFGSLPIMPRLTSFAGTPGGTAEAVRSDPRRPQTRPPDSTRRTARSPSRAAC